MFNSTYVNTNKNELKLEFVIHSDRYRVRINTLRLSQYSCGLSTPGRGLVVA